ncbi:MAG: hypothetical protein JW945_02410, partial [Methanomicrobia archaeon]|nr:hypothetical protein [Methanomicrobia archaeon]
MSSTKKREFFLTRRTPILRPISISLVLIIAFAAFTASFTVAPAATYTYNITDEKVSYDLQNETTAWIFTVSCGTPNQITQFLVEWDGNATDISSITVDGVPPDWWELSTYQKFDITGIRIKYTIKNKAVPVIITLNGLYCADTVQSAIFAGSNDYGPYNIIGPVVAKTNDSDNDGVPDCIDNCSADPYKTEPGVCGCGVNDTDSDSDGSPDCNDGCPDDPNKIDLGVCGCGVADTDSD